MLKAWKEMEEKASQCAQVGHVKEVRHLSLKAIMTGTWCMCHHSGPPVCFIFCLLWE